MTAAYVSETTVTGSGTSAVCSKPASTASGDLLTAAVNTGSGGGTFTAPSGWTQIVAPWTDSNDTAGGTWWKVAGGSEPSTYTFSWTTAGDYCCSIKRYTGANATAPIRTGARVDHKGATGASFTSTALTGTQATDLTVVIGQMGDDNGVTTYTVTNPGSPWTTIDNFKPTSSPKFQGASYAAGSQSGATFTSTSSFAYWNITSFAITAGGTTINGTAALAGAGAVTASGTVTGAAAVSGSGAVTPSAALGQPATLAGAGTAAANATLQQPAALAGAGTASASGTVAGTAALSGTGTVTAVALSQTAALAATSTLTATAAGPSGTAELDGAAFLNSTGVITGTAEADGAGGVGAAPSVVYNVTLGGNGTLAAAVTLEPAAGLAGSGIAAGMVSLSAPATLAAGGTLTAAGVIPGTAALAGAGSVIPAGQVAGAASLAGAGSISASQGIGGSAVLAGSSSVFAGEGAAGASVIAGTGVLVPAASIGPPAGLTAAGSVTGEAVNHINYQMSFM